MPGLRFAVVLLLVAGLATAAHAQRRQGCLQHQEAVDSLLSRFGERLIGHGLTPSGRRVVQVFVSEAGTWTILVKHTNGLSCIVAYGKNWLVDDPVHGDDT